MNNKVFHRPIGKPMDPLVFSSVFKNPVLMIYNNLLRQRVLFQARNIRTSELAAIKIVKLDPGK